MISIVMMISSVKLKTSHTIINMDPKAQDAAVRLLSTRKHLHAFQQELWLYYFLRENPNRGAAKHNISKEEIASIVKQFNKGELT